MKALRKKQAAQLAMMIIALGFMSCGRPENQKPQDAPTVILESEKQDESAQTDEENLPPGTMITISDELGLKDIQDLVQSESGPSLNFLIRSPRRLRKITSSAWSRSENYAVNGAVVSSAKAQSVTEQIRCHFIDKDRDYADMKRGAEYALVKVETIAHENEIQHILYLSAPRDVGSKFIECQTGLGQSLTGFDLQKAFGDHLGLQILIK